MILINSPSIKTDLPMNAANPELSPLFTEFYRLTRITSRISISQAAILLGIPNSIFMTHLISWCERCNVQIQNKNLVCQTTYTGVALMKGQAEVLIELNQLVNQSIPLLKKIHPQKIGVVIQNREIIGLSLGNCGLTEIPRSICHLYSLEGFCVNGNRIAQIPEWLKDLPRLEEVDLNENPLIDPSEIPTILSNVKRIYFNESRVRPLGYEHAVMFTEKLLSE